RPELRRKDNFMTTPPSSEHPNPHQPGATPSPHTPQPQQPISGAPAEPYKSDVPPQPHQPAPGQPMDPYQQAGAQPGAQQPGYPQPEYQYQYAGYGGYSPQQAAYPHPGYAPYQQSGTNVMAILSLVFAFVFSPAGIVLGHV